MNLRWVEKIENGHAKLVLQENLQPKEEDPDLWEDVPTVVSVSLPINSGLRCRTCGQEVNGAHKCPGLFNKKPDAGSLGFIRCEQCGSILKDNACHYCKTKNTCDHVWQWKYITHYGDVYRCDKCRSYETRSRTKEEPKVAREWAVRRVGRMLEIFSTTDTNIQDALTGVEDFIVVREVLDFACSHPNCDQTGCCVKCGVKL